MAKRPEDSVENERNWPSIRGITATQDAWDSCYYIGWINRHELLLRMQFSTRCCLNASRPMTPVRTVAAATHKIFMEESVFKEHTVRIATSQWLEGVCTAASASVMW